jgi:DNA-directed RNA polymerase specialized sigma24 family protein
MLLPARLLLRRMDEAAVAGAALAAAARGLGHRRAAREVGVPEDTVRGWLRRAAGRPGRSGRSLRAWRPS